MTRTLSVVQRVHGYPLFLRQQMEVSIINKKVIPNNVNDDLVNEKIRFKEVMVIEDSSLKTNEGPWFCDLCFLAVV